MKAHIDFETRTGAGEIGKIGAHKYALHPSTDIMCLGIAFEDEPAVVMGFCLPGGDHSLAPRLLEHVSRGGICVAHNAPFELAIWNNVGVRKYGWPVLRPEQMECTMARAYSMGLPGSLENARAAVGLTMEKDLKGNRLMVKMSQPKSRTSCSACLMNLKRATTQECLGCNGCGEIYTWHEEPDQIDRLFAYCRQDVEVEKALDKRLMQISKAEKPVWLLDYKINNRGVYCDIPNAKKAAAVVDLEEDRLNAEMKRITRGEVSTCTANVALKKWLIANGVPTKGVAKNDIAKLLSQTGLPGPVRAAVELRKEAAKSSTAKLKSMLDRACSDSRLRGMYQYHGAHTGRWAARGVQLQNFPRPTIKQAQIERVFAFMDVTNDIESVRSYIETFHGEPMSILSDILRGFLCARPGDLLYAVDWSAIEARVTAWLSGQRTVLDIFNTHGKIYEAAAAEIYGVSIFDIGKDDPRRMIGKVAVLALGFGGGVGALQSMCRAYNLTLEPAFDGLWAIADHETKVKALQRYESELSKARTKWTKAVDKAKKEGVEPPEMPFNYVGITKKEWLASELIKVFWRRANPETVSYWNWIEEAAILAVQNPGRAFTVSDNLPRITFKVSGSFLLCTLPSGRRLCYPYPEVRQEKTDWGSTKPTLTYKYEDSTIRKWVRGSTYGGSLTENVVQAIARDVMVAAMLRVEDHGWEIVMHTHDEIVCEDDPNKSLEDLIDLVTQVPAWASGLPIAAEGWSGRRYRK